MAVLGGLKVDWLGQIQLLDDHTRSEVEVGVDDVDELIGGAVGGAVRVDEDGEGFGNTDSVGELHEGAAAKLRVYEGFGDPAGKVGSRSVDLGEILAGESATPVSSPSTVCIDNDLSAGQTSVTLRATDNEESRRLNLQSVSLVFNLYVLISTYMVDSLIVQVLGRNDLLDDLLLNDFSQLLSSDLLAVLSRNNDSVHSERNNSTIVMRILDGDLGLSIRSQPRDGTITTSSRHRSIKLVSQLQGQREQLRSLIRGISEHDTLVTSTELLKSLLVVQTLCDIGGLLLNGHQHIAGFIVETLGGVIISDVLDCSTDDLLVVETCLGGDFSEDHHHTGLGGRLAGYL